MRYGSVCSGIEAATVAWHGMGWAPQWVSEIEPFPCAVLKHHYPHVPNMGDMTKFKEWDLEPGRIDLLVGGTPCQSFSIAGLRKGLADPRGNLMLTYLAIAAAARPRWLVWENVPGVLSSNCGRDFGTFLGALGELGYGFAYRVLDAQYFGVAQRRRRVFVVGHLGDWRAAAAVLFERESLQGHPAPSREAGKDVAGAITAGAFSGGAGGRPEGAAAGHFQVVNTLDASYGKLQGCSGQDANHGHSHLVPVAFGGNNSSGPIEVATACNAHGGTGRLDFESETFVTHPAIALSGRARGDDGRGYDRPPQFMQEIVGALDTVKPWNVAQHNAVRRLTPTECERLQGFPDNYTDIPYRGKPAADGPRYKALGNSMAVPVMRWIGERIQDVAALIDN